MTESGFRAMLDAISEKGEERSFHLPTGEQQPPQICNPDICPIKACPARNNSDQVGQPCIYYTPKTEDIKEKFQANPNINERLLRRATIQTQIESAVSKILKPVTDRLEALESQSDYKRQPHLRQFNGTPISTGRPRLYRESLRGDTIHND